MKPYTGLSVFFLSLLFMSCGSNKSHTAIRVGKYDKLLAFYRPVNIDTLKVFSSENVDSVGYKYKGVMIDSTTFRLLPGTESYTTDPYLYNQFFATYKFYLDSNTIGLITRVPSQYSCSSIKLYFYYKNSDTISDGLELADAFGDANWYFEKTGWIFKTGKGAYEYFIYNHDVTLPEDDTAGSKDTTVIVNKYWHLRIKNGVRDTLERNAIEFFRKFRNKG
jgi:hypothetical protein